MTTHDNQGRTFAKLSELKSGDIVETDDGFTCRPAGLTQVHKDDIGFYIMCAGEDIEGNHKHEGKALCEKHYLDSQADDGEHCIGIYRNTP